MHLEISFDDDGSVYVYEVALSRADGTRVDIHDTNDDRAREAAAPSGSGQGGPERQEDPGRVSPPYAALSLEWSDAQGWDRARDGSPVDRSTGIVAAAAANHSRGDGDARAELMDKAKAKATQDRL